MVDELQTTRMIGRRFPAARWLTLVMGAWLFASAWVWGREYTARANSMIVGICMTAVALYAMFWPGVRRVNTLLAAWLLFSTLFVFAPMTRIGMWNDIAVAVIVGIASFVPDDQRAESEEERSFVARWARHRAR